MALDTLDIGILSVVLAALIGYFAKDLIKSLLSSNDSTNVSTDSRDLVEVLNETGKKAIVFYGSQTGTAEDYAHKYAKELQTRFQVPTICCDIADYDFDKLGALPSEVDGFKFVTFFMATYGEGEPTDNAVDFFDYLDNECDSLEGLKYLVFGLGNSTYEFYNAISKRLDKKLSELGASNISVPGFGDDGTATMDEDYLAWKESIFDVLKDHLSLEEHDVKYQPSIKLIPRPDLSIENPIVSLGEPNSKYINPTTEETKNAIQYGPFDHTHPYLSPIVKSKELFNSETRHCIHAEFDFSQTNLKYSTGDHLAIWPSNSNEEVEKFLKAFNLISKRNDVIGFETLDQTVSLPFSSPITYEAIVRHHLEISGPVSRQFLQSVHQFAPTEEIKADIARISGHKEIFSKEVTEKYFNIADILVNISKGSSWDDIPFEFLIESIPHLQPRYYSISSSSLSEKQTVHVTAVVENEKPQGSDHFVTGVTTNLLRHIQLAQSKSDLKPNVTYDLDGPRNLFKPFKLPVHIRRSTFKLPTNPATPIILVGPGTGVAPFRGFIREKVKQAESGNNKIGKILLFYGSRSVNEDFLYKNEWPEYSKKLGENFELITAFSRDQKEKIYVQHRMLEYSKEINDLLQKGAFFYVCGDASRMARDVQATLVKILIAERNITEEIANNVVRGFKTSNRFQEDVW
ncbi:hypothetical protein PACTADRAFT_49021 [Pachysolen tannophilus NRRL Y-2460]|uniref:NADPH--cytochrome P450 reductase n=1 Tax=Pachysolen tannophilus NRRL Y-2460 TaxID=669874 RepID=A0A1E4TZV1_PACTA|nr:hypothetical protein PACTADRAFT_49021 [Pachysolen tannophilus NRRL Y-2460]